MEQEIFKDIPINKNYQASNLGRIYSKYTNKILSPKIQKQKKKKVKYCIVNLSDNGIKKSHYVHRLIMLVFNGKMPNDCNVVLHIDDNPLNNRLDNLRYGTAKENVNDCINKGRAWFQVGTKRENNAKNKIPIIAIGNDIEKRFDSLTNAAKILNVRSGNIANVLKGRSPTAGGYKFKYAS
jgi:hypothetical protein